MAERERATSETSERAEQKHRAKQYDSQVLFDPSPTRDQGPISLNETPFHPRMNEHASLLSRIPFTAQRREMIMRLHRTYGNNYVQRLLDSIGAQAKLTVSQPGDTYEQEADKVAEAVTRDTGVQVQRQPAEEEEEELLQTKALQVQRQEDEEEELLQAKALQVQPQEEEEEVQMQSTESPQVVFRDLETRINTTRGGGQPMADGVRGTMEGAFGADFNDVRVHTNSEADVLNRQLNAKAFTTGQDIYFREGEYDPGTGAGRELLAHELTHVVQQTGAAKSIQRDDNEAPTETTSATSEAETGPEPEAASPTALSGEQRSLWMTQVVNPLYDIFGSLTREENPDFDAIQETLNQVHSSVSDFSGGAGIPPEMQESISGFQHRVFSCYMMARSHATGGYTLTQNIGSVAVHSRSFTGNAEPPATP